MEDITRYLDQLIQIIQSGSTELWNVGIKQACINGEIYKWMAIAAGMIIILLLVFASKMLERAEESGNYNSLGNGISACMMFSIGLFALEFWLVPTAIRYLSNPEYYAIRLLIETIKGW